MILFCLAEMLLLFVGTLLWFFIHTNNKDRKVVVSNLAQVFTSCFKQTPPPPIIDPMMIMRIGAFVLLAIALDGNEDVIKSWWDEVFVYIWGVIADFGQIVVYVADLIVPLYNWVITLNAQLTTGTYTILAKCQIKTIIESLVHIGEAMGFLTTALTRFIVAPKGSFDIYNTTQAFQAAVMKQEVVLKCACDGVTPAFGIVFDTIRPTLLANVTNETFNAFLAVPQTAVLAIPPWKEIPDGRRVFQPLKRLAVSLGKYGDEVVDNILRRILLKPAKIIPIFSTGGYTLEGFLGIGEMILHTMARIILMQPITFDPQHIHTSFVNAADSAELTTLHVLSAIVEPLNLGTDTSASAISDASGALNNPILQTADNAAALVDGIQDSAKPLAATLGYIFKAGIGLAMSVVDEGYFILRGEHAGLSFMEILQRWDGEFGKVDQSGIRLQEHFFLNIDRATYAAEDLFGAFSFIPISLRIASRTGNVLIRTALSAEDIVEDQFFHKPLNCGYGTKDDCSDECMFFWDPDSPYLPVSGTREEDSTNTNPCNSLISEWVFTGFEDMIDSLSSIFQRVRPQGEAWCRARDYPTNTQRCAKSNTDFFCATSVTAKEALSVPMYDFRYAVQTGMGFFAKTGDVKSLDMQDRLCDFSSVLYAAAGNIVSILPSGAVNADMKEKLTDVAHSILVLPVESLRFNFLLSRYLVSIITGKVIDWEEIKDNIENQLINTEYRRVEQATGSTSTSITLEQNTADFLVTTSLIPTNYAINVFHSTGVLIGGTNFFTGLADMISVVKDAMSKELINLVSLIFKIGTELLSMVTKGTTDIGSLASDFVTLLKKGFDILATMASQILLSILKLLGPVGDFLIVLWRGICAAASAVEWLTGADFSNICDAVDTVDDARRRLPAMQGHPINMTGFDGDDECDLLVHHYNGRLWGEATYLEQVRLAHCAEQQALVHKMNIVLETSLPTDMIYNWKRKYEMGYEAALGFIVYMKHQTTTEMLLEWDRLGLPRYYLDLWHRLKVEIPWVTVIDDALIETLKPTVELSSMYETAKETLTKLHHTVNRHNMTRVALPNFKMHDFKLGAAYHKVVSHHTMAWGLYTDIDLPPGRLNCTVADNFVRAMVDATDRVEQYYSGPFTEYALPNFMMWLQDIKIKKQKPNFRIPIPSIPSKETAQAAVLYSFEKCHYEDIKCDPAETLERVGRISESLFYVGYVLAGMVIFSMITGISLFPAFAATPLIIMAHTWNYRLTCTPNIPDCFFDDTLQWIQTYKPNLWEDYFPVMTANPTMECPDNYLWSSAYFLARTPLNKLIEFILYQNEEAYTTYQEWAIESDFKDECFIIKSPHLIFTPLMIYGVYAFSNTIMWGLNAVTSYITLALPIISTIYSIEN